MSCIISQILGFQSKSCLKTRCMRVIRFEHGTVHIICDAIFLCFSTFFDVPTLSEKDLIWVILIGLMLI